MNKPKKLRKNGNVSLVHTREDIQVLIQAHNELCDCVEELINKCDCLENKIFVLKSEVEK